LGVSLENVVATIEMPASHQGTGAAGSEELRRALAGALAEEQRGRKTDGDRSEAR
jgi:hypothetical protein